MQESQNSSQMNAKQQILEFDFEAFVEKLMQATEMHLAPQDVQKNVRELIEKQLSLRIAEKLGETDDFYKNIATANPNEELTKIIKQTLAEKPDLSDELAVEVDDLYTEIIEAFEGF